MKSVRPPRRSSKLLINEPALQAIPTLIALIGLTDAIILQQVHYHCERSRDDGWVQRSLVEWHEEDFWCLSLSTVKRTWASLRDRGLIESEMVSTNLGRETRVRVGYDALDRLVEQADGTGQNGEGGSGQNDTTPSGQNDTTGRVKTNQALCNVNGVLETLEGERLRRSPSNEKEEKEKRDPLIAEDDVQVVELGALMRRLIKERDPKVQVETTTRPELLHLRELHRDRGRSIEEIAAVITWVLSGSDREAKFWGPQILSCEALLTHFDRLWGKMPARHRPRGGVVVQLDAPTAEAAETWAPVADTLRSAMDDATFDLWIEPLTAVRVDGGCLVLAAPASISTRVEQRLVPVIKEAMAVCDVELSVRVVTVDKARSVAA